MATTKAAKKPRHADTQRVKPYVERVKALMLEQKAIGSDVTDVCREAKEVAGLDPTTLRFVAREALMDKDKRAERDSKREEYLHALGLAVAAVESGELSARESAKIYNIGKTSLYKELGVRALSANREMEAGDLGEWPPPHDADGVILETDSLTPENGQPATIGANETGAFATDSLSQPATPRNPAAEVWLAIVAAREAHHAAIEAAREARRQQRQREREHTSSLASITADDMPEIPPFLRRVA